MAETHQIAPTALTAHAWNGDRSLVAICANSHEVEIFDTRTWKPTVTLGEHDKLVTSIDWAPRSNQIVTCAQDRNAYVWQLNAEGVWKPTLVLLRLNRAATSVRWSPSETKFAVASGARTIAICSYDDEHDWWMAKHIKKPLRSTVLAIDWHPNSVLLAAGSADSKARVFSAYLKEDIKPPPSNWGTRLPFNTVCGEYASHSGGWVHGVAFSPSGDSLAFCAHDSTVTVVYPGGEGQPAAAVFNVELPSLPYVSLIFATESLIVAAGHDCDPVLFEGDGQRGWSLTGSLDDPAARGAGAVAGAGPARAGGIGRLNNAAFNTFRQADSRGIAGAGNTASPSGSSIAGSGGKLAVAGGSTERMTVHQNTITSVRAYSGEPGAVTRVSTSGVDGRLVIWPVQGGGVGGATSGVSQLSMR